MALRRQSFFLAQLLEGHDIFKVRDEAYGVGAAVEAARANHADVAHGVALTTQQDRIVIRFHQSCGDRSVNRKFRGDVLLLFGPW